MSWDNPHAWRDSYDAWKTREPDYYYDDDESEEPETDEPSTPKPQRKCTRGGAGKRKGKSVRQYRRNPIDFNFEVHGRRWWRWRGIGGHGHWIKSVVHADRWAHKRKEAVF